jgi:hypothetical protein
MIIIIAVIHNLDHVIYQINKKIYLTGHLRQYVVREKGVDETLEISIQKARKTLKARRHVLSKQAEANSTQDSPFYPEFPPISP